VDGDIQTLSILALRANINSLIVGMRTQRIIDESIFPLLFFVSRLYVLPKHQVLSGPTFALSYESRH
jgi:hypothetical protein